MARETGISWTDHTFNPWIGCTKVSPACDGCYAEAMMGENGRYKRVVWGAPGKGAGTRQRTSEAYWKQPLKWDREAHAAAEPRFVFCASLADVFDNEVPTQWRRDLFDLIRATPNLTWLLLTKRPGNIVKLWNETWEPDADGWDFTPPAWPANAAIGCTVVTQEEADRDVPKLLAAKAALTPAFAFLSMEPLLGPVDLNRLYGHREIAGGGDEHWWDSCLNGKRLDIWSDGDVPAPKVDWVITGGETDQGAHEARLTHPAWIRSLRDQCAAAGVAFHHKQHGEWAPVCWMDDELTESLYRPSPRRDPEAIRGCKVAQTVMHSDGSLHPDPADRVAFTAGSGAMTMFKVGKKRSGRAVDGVEHNARPEVAS